MTTKDAAATKSDRTREKILTSALALFRRRGVEKTTMRGVAKAAGVALGAAYYYFPSKDALVLAYYARTQAEHSRRAREVMGRASGLRDRIGAVFHTKLDVLARDRKLLGAIFRSAADPDDPASLFGKETKAVRDESILLFDEALDDADLDPRTRAIVARALWSLHMGLLLYFMHDASPQQEKTRYLTDGALDLAVQLVQVSPMLAPVTVPLASVLEDAGLL
jgi:AcrR family transcriptional regulator